MADGGESEQSYTTQFKFIVFDMDTTDVPDLLAAYGLLLTIWHCPMLAQCLHNALHVLDLALVF